jgi:hypothetical protein
MKDATETQDSAAPRSISDILADAATQIESTLAASAPEAEPANDSVFSGFAGAKAGNAPPIPVGETVSLATLGDVGIVLYGEGADGVLILTSRTQIDRLFDPAEGMASEAKAKMLKASDKLMPKLLDLIAALGNTDNTPIAPEIGDPAPAQEGSSGGDEPTD